MNIDLHFNISEVKDQRDISGFNVYSRLSMIRTLDLNSFSLTRIMFERKS